MKQTNPVFHRQQAAAFPNTAEVQPRSAGRSASYRMILELRLSAFSGEAFLSAVNSAGMPPVAAFV